MKRLIMLLVAISLLVGLKNTIAFAECAMPPVIKKDAYISIIYIINVVANVEKKVVILDVDKKSCWLYVKDCPDGNACSNWLNFNNVDAMIYHGLYSEMKK